MKKTLSQPALDLIENFKNLNIGDKTITCPYFNNRRNKVRGGLKVEVGKASIDEIKEEVKILSKKKRKSLEKMNEEQVKKFLVDNNIGVDCSAFAFYVLNKEIKEKNNEKLKKLINFPNKSFLRKLISKIRTIENINVKTLSQPENSKEVGVRKIEPGDFISILNSGKNNSLDHILVIHEIEYKNNLPKTIKYTHSFRWSSDGQFGHGIKQGEIKINDLDQTLLDQDWIEANEKNEKNETYKRAKQAEDLTVRRIKL